jgi:hypothetical protein
VPTKCHETMGSRENKIVPLSLWCLLSSAQRKIILMDVNMYFREKESKQGG